MTVVSVIIPIYNTEKYIKRCLDSVINQSLKDIEIICVNDGSTDSSLRILKEFEAKDSRIKVINLEENKGVSYARNFAIKNSNSPYLFFLDSDDLIEPSCLEILYNEIIKTSTDITFGAYSYYVNDEFNHSRTDVVKDFLQKGDYTSYYILFCQVIGKMISKNFIDEKFLSFNINLITAEDFIFMFQCISEGARFSAIPIALYNYFCFREGSATSNIVLKNTEFEAIKSYFNSGCFDKLTEHYKVIFTNTCMQNYISWYCIYRSPIQKKEIRKVYKYLKKNAGINILKQCPQFYTFKNLSKNLLENIFSFESWVKLIRRKLKNN